MACNKVSGAMSAAKIMCPPTMAMAQGWFQPLQWNIGTTDR